MTVDLSKTHQTADTAATRYWLPRGEAVLASGSPVSITFQLSGAVKDHAADIENQPLWFAVKAVATSLKKLMFHSWGNQRG